MLFLFHKLTGTDSLVSLISKDLNSRLAKLTVLLHQNYYAPRIFELIGVNKGSSSLLATVRRPSSRT